VSDSKTVVAIGSSALWLVAVAGAAVAVAAAAAALASVRCCRLFVLLLSMLLPAG